MANNNIPFGNTPKLPMTTHIKTKATNQDKNVVCSNVNFLAMKKIVIANSKDQIPQTAPLMGAEGKINPILL